VPRLKYTAKELDVIAEGVVRRLKARPIFEDAGKAAEPEAPVVSCPPLADAHSGEDELRLCGVTGGAPAPSPRSSYPLTISLEPLGRTRIGRSEGGSP